MRGVYIIACVVVIIVVSCACVKYKATFTDSLALISALLLLITSIYVLRMGDHMVYGNASITDVAMSFIFLLSLLYVVGYSIVKPISSTVSKIGLSDDYEE